jgi:hypothetical protein
MRRFAIYSFVASLTFLIGSISHRFLRAEPPVTTVSNSPSPAPVYLMLEPHLPLPPSPVIHFPLPPSPVIDSTVADFDPSGDYHPVKQLSDKSETFVQFDLNVRKSRGKMRVRGKVMNLGVAYRFSHIAVSRQQLEFTTVNIGGVEYRFKGYFLLSGNFANQTTDDGQVGLRGTLQKFKHDQKVAETTTTFRYYPGC